jgi:hypothetical protein
LIKEEETVSWQEYKEKGMLCSGSADFRYDESNRLIEIIRSDGPSQKIKYLPNGLIKGIETTGKTCKSKPYHWNWTYMYTYRK